MKQINDLNLAALASGLSEALTKEIGGEFYVTVTKLERTNPDFTDDKLHLSFVVDDVSHMERCSESPKGKRFS
jgi:hypothetical protein